MRTRINCRLSATRTQLDTAKGARLRPGNKGAQGHRHYVAAGIPDCRYGANRRQTTDVLRYFIVRAMESCWSALLTCLSGLPLSPERACSKRL